MTTIQASSIGVRGVTVEYDSESDQYEIDLQNVSLIALDARTKVIRIKIKSDQIKLHSSQSPIDGTLNSTHSNHVQPPQKTWEDEMAERIKHMTDNISIKETQQQQIQNKLQQAIEDEDFATAAQLAQDKKQIVSEVNELKQKRDTLQDDLQNKKSDASPSKQQSYKDHITDKLQNIQNELSIKQSEKEEIQTEINTAVAEDDFVKAGTYTPKKKELISQIKALQTTAQTLQSLLDEEEDNDDAIGVEDDEDDDTKDEEDDAQNASVTDKDDSVNEEPITAELDTAPEEAQDATDNEQTEEDDETETESETPKAVDKMKSNAQSTPIAIEKENTTANATPNTVSEAEPSSQPQPESEWDAVFVDKEVQKTEVEQVKENEDVPQAETDNDATEREQNDVMQTEAHDVDAEPNAKQEESEENQSETQRDDEDDDEKKELERTPSSDEVVDIDMAMNEIILKNAQKKNSDDTNEEDKQNKTPPSKSRSYVSSDTGASTANEYQFKVDWKIAFTPHNIKKEWVKLIPKSTDASSEHFACGTVMSQCPCIERLIFVMNHYMLWLKSKISSSRSKRYLNRGYPRTMTVFLSLLINYNKVRLMNDYFHIKRYHMNRRGFADHFKQKLITTQCISLRSAQNVCLQWDRNNGKKELYRLQSSEQRRQLYLITPDAVYLIKELSSHEMNEIQLQQFLDMIHSTFIHKAISDGKKFVNTVYNAQNTMDTTVNDDAKEDDDEQIVEAPNHTFGVLFNYWDKNKMTYVAPKYGTLKKELLNNMYHTLEKNDYNLLWYKAKDFIQCNEGRYCISKRIISERYSKVNKLGKEITMDHVLALMIYCNYYEMQNQLKRGCRRVRKRETLDAMKVRHSEIVNWCKLIHESIYCFGGSLTGENANEYLYHMINVRLAFNILQIQFYLPTSTTSKYVIAKSLCKKKGICLKLRATYGVSSELNCFLDVSNVSDFPNECECVVFGDKFDIEDVVIRGVSTYARLNVLKLYYQIIRGRWYTHNKNQFKKKNQREIIKMINHMMNSGQEKEEYGSDGVDVYVQSVFESMTKNLRKNIIWVNRNGMEQLLPELKQLFFDEFVDHLQKNYNIKTKYGNVVILKVSKEDIMKSSREGAIYSVECKHPVNIINGKNINDLVFTFRCYQKYDHNAKLMMLKGEFVIKPFSNRVQSIRISGGIWFPQIYVDKWDFCTFTHNKLAKGAALFPIKKLDKLNDELIVKICFQIKDIVPAKV
eukprot:1089287_1